MTSFVLRVPDHPWRLIIPVIRMDRDGYLIPCLGSFWNSGELLPVLFMKTICKYSVLVQMDGENVSKATNRLFGKLRPDRLICAILKSAPIRVSSLLTAQSCANFDHFRVLKNIYVHVCPLEKDQRGQKLVFLFGRLLSFAPCVHPMDPANFRDFLGGDQPQKHVSIGL